MQSVNFQTTNPAQLTDRATEMQIAMQLDEQNNLAVAEYTSAGAIALGGVAFLKTGAASAMTLAQPLPGSQLNGGNDGMRLAIIALDAEAYTVTTAANGINGNADTATWTAAISNNIVFRAWNGVWYLEGTPRGVALTEV